MLELMDNFAKIVNVRSKINICRDPKDNFLLSLALDAHADFLLTGDKDLLSLKKIGQAKITTITHYLNKK